MHSRQEAVQIFLRSLRWWWRCAFWERIIGRLIAHREVRRQLLATVLEPAGHGGIDDAGRQQGPFDGVRRFSGEDHLLDGPQLVGKDRKEVFMQPPIPGDDRFRLSLQFGGDSPLVMIAELRDGGLHSIPILNEEELSVPQLVFRASSTRFGEAGHDRLVQFARPLALFFRFPHLVPSGSLHGGDARLASLSPFQLTL